MMVINHVTELDDPPSTLPEQQKHLKVSLPKKKGARLPIPPCFKGYVSFNGVEVKERMTR